MTLELSDIAGVLDAHLGAHGVRGATVKGWSVDTRTLQAGDLFFALRGPNHDGNAYVRQALEKGAVAAVREAQEGMPSAPEMAGPGMEGRVIVVADPLRALQDLAAWARQHWGGTVVAVTGSAGKTTTKDIIAHLLATHMAVGKTIGNFNNHVGVPLSILRLPNHCRVAVLEIGMNHAGEIRALSELARPRVGVVTNVGYAHVENFRSIEEVALAKRELIESLPAGGTAVLNADDERVARFAGVHTGPRITFGTAPHADVRADGVELHQDGTRFTVDGVPFISKLAGWHGVSNLLAGIAVARAFGIPARELKEAVATFTPGKMRGDRLELAGVTIWNDCYNSNPEAARAMVDVLRATPASRRIAVLGEMLELGWNAEPLHREIGRYVAASGIDVLVGVRGAARHMVDEAVLAGLSGGAAFFFEEAPDAGDFVRQHVRAGDAVLFKGSRGVQVEQALERAFPRAETMETAH